MIAALYIFPPRDQLVTDTVKAEAGPWKNGGQRIITRGCYGIPMVCLKTSKELAPLYGSPPPPVGTFD